MGRLFWKLFLFILLAQLTTAMGVGLVFSLRHKAEREALKMHPNDAAVIALASKVLAEEGEPGLRRKLQEWQSMPLPRVFAVDGEGKEILQRKLPAGAGLVKQSVNLKDGRHWQLLLEPPPPPPGMERIPPSPGHIPLPALFGALFGSLLFAALLAQYLSKPISLMSEAFQSVAEGNMDVNLSGKIGRRRDELADLGREFDRVALRLKLLIEGRQRLLHDVSHELRSPLARISAAVDLAQQQPEKMDDWLARIQRESERMDVLVGEILAVARLDAAAGQRQLQSIPLAEWLDELLSDAAFEAGSHGGTVELVNHGPDTLHCEPELLARAVENVLRNAIRHGGAGGRILFVVDQDNGGVRFTVADRGPGVPEAELESIFQPFFRSAHAQATGGYGLGLALARRIVEAHGGVIRAANRVGGGLEVVIELPA